MQFASTGGIFLRLDSSGNLNVYNTSGNSVAQFAGGGLFSSAVNKGTFAQNTAVTSTTSASHVFTGDYVDITPQISGKVLVVALLPTTSINSAGATGNFRLWSGTGATGPAGHPAGGTAVSGSQQTADCSHTFTASGDVHELAIPILLTGLTNGTQVSFGISAATSAGTLSWASLAFSRFWALEV